MSNPAFLIQLLDIHIQKRFISKDHCRYNATFFWGQTGLVYKTDSVPDMIQNIFDGIYIVLQYLKGISSEFIVNSFLFVIFPAIKHTGIGGNRKFQKCSIQKKKYTISFGNTLVYQLSDEYDSFSDTGRSGPLFPVPCRSDQSFRWLKQRSDPPRSR